MDVEMPATRVAGGADVSRDALTLAELALSPAALENLIGRAKKCRSCAEGPCCEKKNRQQPPTAQTLRHLRTSVAKLLGYALPLRRTDRILLRSNRPFSLILCHHLETVPGPLRTSPSRRSSFPVSKRL